MHINKSFLMEFLGTFFFILTVAMGLHPFAIASMLMAWLYIGGYVSGAHYNPMVSLAVKLSGKSSWYTFIRYSLAQILGGFVAYWLAGNLQGDITVPAPAAGATLFQAFTIEILLSFVLAYLILTVATSAHYKNSNVFGFAIAFTIPALAAIGAQTSGGLFNPAIALGSALCGLLFYGIPLMVNHLLMYVGGACIGGFLAARTFNYFENK